MKRRYLFLISFIVSLPFWISVNYLQAFFEEQLVAKDLDENPKVFYLADISKAFVQKSEENKLKEELSKITAKSYAVAYLRDGEDSEIVFSKEEGTQLPIASITKLLTILTSADLIPQEKEIIIKQDAVDQAEKTGNLQFGEKIKYWDLVKMSLIESSNDAAFALASDVGLSEFIFAMNSKAQVLGMKDSYFFNPTGIDDETGMSLTNYSTSKDLLRLAEGVINSPVILNILSIKEELFYLNGVLHHDILNTNELLGIMPEIIGGKTGTTDLAGQCLVEILKTENKEDYMVFVVLGSSDRYTDMRILINLAKNKNSNK